MRVVRNVALTRSAFALGLAWLAAAPSVAHADDPQNPVDPVEVSLPAAKAQGIAPVRNDAGMPTELPAWQARFATYEKINLALPPATAQCGELGCIRLP
jgi:hypothetical protein